MTTESTVLARTSPGRPQALFSEPTTKSEILADMALENHRIDSDRLIGILFPAPGKAKPDALLEAHRRYIDIQYVLAGAGYSDYKE